MKRSNFIKASVLAMIAPISGLFGKPKESEYPKIVYVHGQDGNFYNNHKLFLNDKSYVRIFVNNLAQLTNEKAEFKAHVVDQIKDMMKHCAFPASEKSCVAHITICEFEGNAKMIDYTVYYDLGHPGTFLTS
jgi:hypothetical protein